MACLLPNKARNIANTRSASHDDAGNEKMICAASLHAFILEPFARQKSRTCGGGGQPHRGLWWWRDSIPTVERCALPTQCSFFRWNCRSPDRPRKAPRKLATPAHQILRLGCVGLLPTSTLHVRSPHTPLLLALAGYKSTSPKEAGSCFLEWVFAEVEKDESKERRAKRKLQKGFFDRAGR